MMLHAAILLITASGAPAQVEVGGTEVRFLVFDPAARAGAGDWVRSMTVRPGQQIEWRVDVVYTGTQTPWALGAILFQPTIRNADNADNGDGIDTLGPFGDIPGDPGAFCDVIACDGGGGAQELARLGAPLDAYGRVNFTGHAQSATSSNIHTVFRHSNGSGNAPAGDWIRIAGSYVTVWPQAIPGTSDPATLNLVMRGIDCEQINPIQPDARFVRGPAPTVFRQAIHLSDNPAPRVIELSTFMASLRRVGGTTSTDDTRFLTWSTGPSDPGTRRVTPVFAPASIFITGTECDSIDYNRDTLFPDTQDIDDYLTVFSGAPCPTAACADLDFNNDGLFPDTADIESLLSVFAGGPCLE
ncbi:MAG: hypothetical protein U0637_03750 [Phycisphaerales bacterium]